MSVTTNCNSWMNEQHLMKWINCFRWMSFSQWCLQRQKHQQRTWLTRHWCTTGDSGMVNGTRRCRIVAREFKTTSTDENNFSPTSSFASVRMLLVLALIYGLAITALDVKDAFLMVPQNGDSLCENSTMDPGSGPAVPTLTGFSSDVFLGKEMRRCGGTSILDSFANKLNLKHFQEPQQFFVTEISIERCLSTYMWMTFCWCASLVMLNGFKQQLALTLTMKVDGPHMPGDGSQVMYLKKRMTMRPGGILMQPNATYIPKLVGLMKVRGRRRKGLPYHATLEAFSADLIVESELLDQEQAANFRSGLGLALYPGDGSARHPICSEDPSFLYGKTYGQSTFSFETFGFVFGWNS